MPRRDGTGPMGQGAMTGGGFGPCGSGNGIGLGRGRGFFGRGGGHGRGRVMQGGGGHGFRHWFRATGLTRWMRANMTPQPITPEEKK